MSSTHAKSTVVLVMAVWSVSGVLVRTTRLLATHIEARYPLGPYVVFDYVVENHAVHKNTTYSRFMYNSVALQGTPREVGKKYIVMIVRCNPDRNIFHYVKSGPEKKCHNGGYVINGVRCNTTRLYIMHVASIAETKKNIYMEWIGLCHTWTSLYCPLYCPRLRPDNCYIRHHCIHRYIHHRYSLRCNGRRRWTIYHVTYHVVVAGHVVMRHVICD